VPLNPPPLGGAKSTTHNGTAPVQEGTARPSTDGPTGAFFSEDGQVGRLTTWPAQPGCHIYIYPSKKALSAIVDKVRTLSHQGVKLPLSASCTA
jgi:hypothetical protein